MNSNSQEQQPTASSPDVDGHPATQILPHLFLGNGRDAADAATLSRLGITRVLNVTADLPCRSSPSSVIYKQLPAADSGQQNLRQYFDDAFHFIGTFLHDDSRRLTASRSAVSFLRLFWWLINLTAVVLTPSDDESSVK